MIEPTPERIAEQFREKVRRGEWKPGTVINQKELAAELGVSRIPVREALRALGSEGLVTLQPGQGARVAELNAADIFDLYELRLALEPGLAVDIIDGISPAESEHLARLAAQMEATEDRDQWSSWNYEFHRRIYLAAGRPHAIRIVLQVMDLVEPYSRLYVHLLGGVSRASREHLLMVEAIRDRDASALEKQIASHLAGARDRLLDDSLWKDGRFVAPGN